MSRRIILQSWAGECLDLTSPAAEVLVKEGIARVSLSKYGGELADATVLVFDEGYLHRKAEGGDPEYAHRKAREAVLLLDPAGARPFQIKRGVDVWRGHTTEMGEPE